MDVHYRTQIPYPFERVLAQYFDLEHVETVHPTTLGEYRLLEVEGNRILFEQRWPSWLGVRLRTVIEQVWVPPEQIRFRFLKGFLRGVGVSARLHDAGENTDIEEVYHLPLRPDVSWLRALVRPWVRRGADAIWREDLAVALCNGGWPGVPGQDETTARSTEPHEPAPPEGGGRWVRVAEQEDVPEGHAQAVDVEGRDIVLWRHEGHLHALDNRCPHAGGPLSLGWLAGDQVVCPWHGTRFGLTDGRPCGGPAEDGVAAYPVRLNGQGILILLRS